MSKLTGVDAISKTHVSYKGITYVKTSAAPKVGDLIRMTKHYSFLPLGAFYVVRENKGGMFSDLAVIDEDGQKMSAICTEDESDKRDVYTPVAESKPARRFNVGDIVQIVANNSHHQFPIGEQVRIVKLFDSHSYKANYLDGRDWWLIRDNDIDTPVTAPQAKQPELSLEDRLAAAEKRITALESFARRSGVAADTPATAAAAPAQLPKPPAPKVSAKAPLTRQAVIERAKADVLQLISTNRNYINPRKDHTGFWPVVEGVKTWWTPMQRVKFEVDSKNGTVVALIHFLKQHYDGKLYAKGKAVCDPEDTFNVHIGKAIAMRRAFGLEIPDEYYRSPQPTEPKVGDIVKGVHAKGGHYYHEGRTFTLVLSTRGMSLPAFKYAENEDDWIYRADIGRIVDDSGADV